MNKAEALQILLENPENDVSARLDRIESMLLKICSAIALPQKDACKLLEVTDDTMRNMALRGDVEPLQKDGSTRNFYTLTQIEGLKPRKRKRR